MIYRDKTKKIWILEDDESCNFIYGQILECRYSLTYFSNLSSFIEKLKTKQDIPDLIIADIMLPDGTFMDFLNSKNKDFLKDLDFIVVSSLEDVDILRESFIKGALDYLIKPFSKSELLVKVQKKLGLFDKAEVENNLDSEIYKIEDLTQKEQKILLTIAASKKQKISRKEIIDTVWPRTFVHPKTLDVHLHNLRKKVISHGINIMYDGEMYFCLKQ